MHEPDHVPIEPWDVPPVTKDVAKLLTSSDSPMQEVADSLILLVQVVRQNNQLLIDLIQTQKDLVQAIREDGEADPDGDEQPAQYLDGSPVR